MALALPKMSLVSVEDIIREFEASQYRPDDALRAAVQHADRVAPPVIKVVEMAADGVYLLPKQDNLLFWGIHVLAAGRRTELYHPLLRLVRRASDDRLESLLGDATTETLVRILLSVFDGNAAPVIETCLDPMVDGEARRHLFQVLARLTFDGVVSRDVTFDLLARFEREQLAPPRSYAWMGWQDTLILLGIEELRERLHAAWEDGRILERKIDRDDHDLTLSKARAMAPGDAALFIQHGITPIDDAVAALHWIRPQSEPEEHDVRRQPVALHSDSDDLFALSEAEIEWLTGFFDHKTHPSSALVEILDGYFCGLIAGPSAAVCGDGLSRFWSTVPMGGPAGANIFDNPEQEEYVNGLLTRHWNTITHRLHRGDRYTPLLRSTTDLPEGVAWAAGFLRAFMYQESSSTRVQDDFVASFLLTLASMVGRDDISHQKLSDRQRSEVVDLLPISIKMLFDRKHGRIDPLARGHVPIKALGIKVGRNDPCPCGSGKKYKRCCGS